MCERPGRREVVEKCRNFKLERKLQGLIFFCTCYFCALSEQWGSPLWRNARGSEVVLLNFTTAAPVSNQLSLAKQVKKSTKTSSTWRKIKKCAWIVKEISLALITKCTLPIVLGILPFAKNVMNPFQKKILKAIHVEKRKPRLKSCRRSQSLRGTKKRYVETDAKKNMNKAYSQLQL